MEFSATDETSSTEDHGLDAPVPQADTVSTTRRRTYNPWPRHRADHQPDPARREARISKLVFNPTAMPRQQKDTRVWHRSRSDPPATSLPEITDALDSAILRPNIGVLGRRTATILRRHPKIVKRIHNGTLGDEGMVPMAFLQELLELEAIYVGEARLNIARPGQNPSLIRARWGRTPSFIYRDRLAGYPQRHHLRLDRPVGRSVSGSIADPNIGLRGGQRVRVGESVKELVTAPDLGFFFENAVAAVSSTGAAVRVASEFLSHGP
ncbi:phage capsid protein [Pseudomonas aeruginosa]|nr:phage capsid protein [Pseudomonas aeruginosa]